LSSDRCKPGNAALRMPNRSELCEISVTQYFHFG
jgi:hypothetical protein